MNKVVSMALLGATLTVISAQTLARHGYGHGHHRRHHGGGCYSDACAVVAGGLLVGAGAAVLANSCAPEVVNGNVSATDRVLSKLAAKAEFKNEVKFNAEVSRIQKITDVKVKMSAYFDLVDANNTTDVAYFIGARKNEFSKYSSILQEKFEMDPANADVIVEELTSSLKGSLK